jgi:hypothetical protein
LPLVSNTPEYKSGFQFIDKFADGAATEPTRLAAHFAGVSDLKSVDPNRFYDLSLPRSRYVYEVCFDNSSGKPWEVIQESLRRYPGENGRSVRIFERARGKKLLTGKDFGISVYNRFVDNLRTNVSLISALAQVGHKPSALLKHLGSLVFSNIFIDRLEITDRKAVQDFYMGNDLLLEELNGVVERIDLGISKAELVFDYEGPTLHFKHDGLSNHLSMSLESHGTRRFIQIFPLIILALRLGGIAILDEIDQAIHPLLLPEIVRWFHDKDRNPLNAQLWISCHTPSLLEELVKEEIYFCVKSGDGQTQIYGLQDIQGVERSDNFYKKYLGGVYGAIPILG